MCCPSCPTRQLPTWFLKAPVLNLSVSFRQNRSANITCTNRLSTSVRAKHLVRARCDQNHRARIFPNFADASAMLPCSRRDPEKCPFMAFRCRLPCQHAHRRFLSLRAYRPLRGIDIAPHPHRPRSARCCRASTRTRIASCYALRSAIPTPCAA